MSDEQDSRARDAGGHKIRRQVTGRNRPRAASKPELAPEITSTLVVMQPKSSPPASAQVASPQVASPLAMAASPAPGGAANPPAAAKLQAAATVMPRNSRASMPGSAPAPAPKEQLPKSEAAQAPSQQRPQAIPAARIAVGPASRITDKSACGSGKSTCRRADADCEASDGYAGPAAAAQTAPVPAAVTPGPLPTRSSRRPRPSPH